MMSSSSALFAMSSNCLLTCKSRDLACTDPTMINHSANVGINVGINAERNQDVM